MKRRSHDALKKPALAECSNCHAPVLSHNACPKCGYYKGQKVDHTISAKSKEKGKGK